MARSNISVRLLVTAALVCLAAPAFAQFGSIFRDDPPRPPEGADILQKRLFEDRYRVFFDAGQRAAPTPGTQRETRHLEKCRSRASSP